MELKDFIRQTLEQIVDGVSAAKESVEQKNGIINPTAMSYTLDGKYNNIPHPLPSNVEFDVGLTATSNSGTKEGIGVFLGSINLGKSNENGTATVAVTRVKFIVPLILPAGESVAKPQRTKVPISGI